MGPGPFPLPRWFSFPVIWSWKRLWNITWSSFTQEISCSCEKILTHFFVCLFLKILPSSAPPPPR
ncbi:rCG45339, partial [Rattus norvegicus]